MYVILANYVVIYCDDLAVGKFGRVKVQQVITSLQENSNKLKGCMQEDLKSLFFARISNLPSFSLQSTDFVH